MATGGGARQPSDPARRLALHWGIVIGLIVLAFVGTIAVLNSTLYSAQGFVGSYLVALERSDARSALATPGVQVPDGAAAELLVPDALGGLSDIRLVSETDIGGGIHRVVYSFELGGSASQAEFEIEHTANRFGFFQEWSFVTSPTGLLEITPVNEARFEANDVRIESEDGPGAAVRYAVLTPGAFTLQHESTYLESTPDTVRVPQPGATIPAVVNARANSEFVELVQDELDGLLDECATQEVLQPTGCPFGETISNRLEGVPEWSIVEHPDIEIIPGPTPGTWQVPPTSGTAHLVVGVRSLFDGTLSTFDEDVDFSVSYLITFDTDGQVSIIGQ